MMKNTIKKLFVLSMILGAAALASAQAGDVATQRIINEVHHQLALLPYYNVFDNLAYKVEGSKVTLLGQVTQPELKSSAGNVVKKIEGVQTVDNQIEVLPLSPDDDNIRRETYRAIYSRPQLEQYQMRAVPPIHIIVKNGAITLEGVVSTEADKDVAGITAKTVPGAFGVTNNLRVEK